MKKLLGLVLALILSFQVSAKPLEQDKLDLINQTIAELLSDGGNPIDVNMNFSNIFVDQNTLLVRAATLNAEILMSTLTVAAGVAVQNETLEINLSAEARPLQIGMDADAVQGLASTVFGFIERINAQGTYFAELKLESTTAGTSFNVNMIPVGPDAHPSFINAVMEGFIPADLENEVVRLALQARFSATQDLVVTAQTSLTNIMNDLVEGSLPADEDVSALLMIVSELLGTLF